MITWLAHWSAVAASVAIGCPLFEWYENGHFFPGLFTPNGFVAVAIRAVPNNYKCSLFLLSVYIFISVSRSISRPKALVRPFFWYCVIFTLYSSTKMPKNFPFILYCWFFNHETHPKKYILARSMGKYPSRYEVTITLFKSGLILPKAVAPVGYSTAAIMSNLRSCISSLPHKNFCRCWFNFWFFRLNDGK